MKNEAEITEINQLNAQIQRNVIAGKRAELARREAAKEARIEKAFMACRFPVALTAATWFVVAMGLANPALGWLVSLPCLCGVCYQVGRAR